MRGAGLEGVVVSTQLGPKQGAVPRPRLGEPLGEPGALTVVLLLQPAQDPEDSAFGDFEGVCLRGAVGKLLPGPQLPCGRFRLPSLTGAFLQLPLVIAGEAAPPSSALPRLLSPPHSLFLSPCSVRPAQELRVFVLALPFTSVTVGNLLPCSEPQSAHVTWGQTVLSPSHWKSPDFSGGSVNVFIGLKAKTNKTH